MKKRKNIMKIVSTALAAVLAVFEIYTAATIPLTPFEQRTIHLGIVFALVFIFRADEANSKAAKAVFIILAAVSIGLNAYIFLNWDSIAMRSTSLTNMDIIVSVLLITIVLITTYKTIGIWMVLIASVFILYAVFGAYMPGVFRFRGISVNRALSSICLSSEGIFGSCTGVSATFVFMFLLFGECLLAYGGGDFIMKMSLSAFGGMRGAASKIAVVASGLFGMVSGSATANIAAIGTFTIPLMKSRGYKGEFAGGVVAAAATGGLLMPPVMGTTAFIMAAMIGVPYGEICLIAAIPAVLYFASLFTATDLYAVRVGDNAMTKEERPKGREVFRSGWYHVISIAVLVVLLCVLQISASRACFYSMVTLIAADYAARLINGQRIDLKAELTTFKNIFVRAAKAALPIACACACAGIVVGVFSATGLNLRFSNILVELSGGNQFALLLLSMVGAIILGMGLPSVSVYILMAIIVAPALVKTGIPVISAHMFLFYFGLMAPITPPVGIAFYVASGLAESKPMKTGIQAIKLALPGFILPFMFIYKPGIILQDVPLQIVWAAGTTVLGLLALAVSFEGILKKRVKVAVRILLFVGAVLTIFPEMISSYIGIIMIAALLILEMLPGTNRSVSMRI